MDVLSPFILSSVILIDFYGEFCPRLDLSIQALRGLRLRAPGIVPCIISFSLVSSWCDHSMLASHTSSKIQHKNDDSCQVK